jgi:hypothetical protein
MWRFSTMVAAATLVASAHVASAQQMTIDAGDRMIGLADFVACARSQIIATIDKVDIHKSGNTQTDGANLDKSTVAILDRVKSSCERKIDADKIVHSYDGDMNRSSALVMGSILTIRIMIIAALNDKMAYD